MRRALAAATLAGMIVTFVPATSMAGGVTVPRIGGLNFSSPVEALPTALWWNPAAMGLMDGLQLQLDLAYTLANGKYTRTYGPPGSEDRVYEEMKFKTSAPAPFAAATYRIGRFAIGVGVYIPFGRSIDYPGTEEAATDAPQDITDAVNPGRYHLIRTSFRHWYIPVGLSVEVIPEMLWLGATLNVVYGQFLTWAAVDRSPPGESPAEQAISRLGAVCTGGLNPDGTSCVTSPGEDVSKDKFLTALNFGFTAGLLARTPSKKLTIGVSITSGIKPHFTGRSVITLNGTSFLLSGLDGNTVEADVDLTYRLPWTLNAGAQYKLKSGLEIDLWYTYQHYKVHDVFTICVGAGIDSLTPASDMGPSGAEACADDAADNTPFDKSSFVLNMLNKATIRYRGYRDNHAVALGVAYPLVDDKLKIGVNVMYESSAVPNASLAIASLDGPKLDFMLAVSVTPVKWFTLNAGFSYIFSPKSDNTGESSFRRGDGDDAFRGTEEFGPADGEYSLSVIRFGGGIILRFFQPKEAEKVEFELPPLPTPETAPAETAPAETAPAETAPAETAPAADGGADEASPEGEEGG